MSYRSFLLWAFFVVAVASMRQEHLHRSLDAERAVLLEQISTLKNSIRSARVEWSLLTAPNHLAVLNERYGFLDVLGGWAEEQVLAGQKVDVACGASGDKEERGC